MNVGPTSRPCVCAARPATGSGVTRSGGKSLAHNKKLPCDFLRPYKKYCDGLRTDRPGPGLADRPDRAATGSAHFPSNPRGVRRTSGRVELPRTRDAHTGKSCIAIFKGLPLQSRSRKRNGGSLPPACSNPVRAFLRGNLGPRRPEVDLGVLRAAEEGKRENGS